MKNILYAFTIVLFVSTLLSFANLQIIQTDHRTLISFGSASQTIEEPATSEEFISEDEFYSMMNELQAHNIRVIKKALELAQEQHQQQLENIIQTLTTYYDQRRQQDLVKVSEGLAQLEEETYCRFLQTEEALYDLIFALNVQQTDE